MNEKFKSALCIALFFPAVLWAQKPLNEARRPNVLFLFVDDLRPELGSYGNKYIHSPNIDKLASQSTVFTRHYVTVPTCGASRASILTGQLPKSPAEVENNAMEAKKRQGVQPESFVQQFRQNGYYTVGIGKISHSPDGYVYGYREPKSNVLELPNSWDEMLFDPGKWGTGWNAFFGYADGSNRNDMDYQTKPYEMAEVDDEGYPDGLTANLAVSKLKELAERDEPFFLGVGFIKPHLPFAAPKKYWDMYDEENISLTPSPDIPAHVNKASLHESGEFNFYKKGDEKASLEKPVSDAYARKLRHGYFAAVSYTDALIGKVLDELKRLGLEENTIIILWGDHGWHLGDDRVWGKHTLFEWALRSPLMIKAPGVSKAAVTEKIVSSIDVYPTLMDLTHVKMPYETQGISLVPLLKNPSLKNWHHVAYSYFRKGISMRTDKWRLTRYFRKQQPVIELYNEKKDPYENVNVAAEKKKIVKRLMPLWEKGNTGLYEN